MCLMYKGLAEATSEIQVQGKLHHVFYPSNSPQYFYMSSIKLKLTSSKKSSIKTSHRLQRKCEDGGGLAHDTPHDAFRFMGKQR